MENEKNNIEKGELIKYPLPKWNKSDELYETISEKLSWVDKDYRDVINGESESDEKITEKDIYEANLSDIEKRLDKNSTEYKLFQTLRKKGLKIFINPKTDISRTEGFYIIWGLGPITQQSRYTMGVDDDYPDEQVYINKFIHEMCHCVVGYATNYAGDWNIARIYTCVKKLRSDKNISVTKLGDIGRYSNIFAKFTEDIVELCRMYIQDSNNLKKYLGELFEQIGEDEQAELGISAEGLYNDIEHLVNTFLNQPIN